MSADWVLETLRECEPAALHSQLPVVWHRAEGARVFDAEGRSWLDWTSGILTANAGHAPAEVVEAICAQARQGLLHAYMFPTEIRARVVRALTSLTGYPQVALFTTGAEAVEASLKISRRYAMSAGRHRAIVVTFDLAFHGRTMGAQLAGGNPAQQTWTGTGEDIFVRVPYPEHGTPWSPQAIESALADRHAGPGDVACVIVEVYQGSTLRVLDPDAARALRDWCTRHGAVLIVDEIQSGFGRTGHLFGSDGLGIRPDLLLCGKGLSGSLPVSAVLIADPALAAPLRPGELGTTHSGNPVALAAVEANLGLFGDGTLVANARQRGEQLADGLAAWVAEQPQRRRVVASLGLVAGVSVLDGAGAADAKAARRLVAECADQGLLLCAPVGPDGTLIKIMPPLVTDLGELREGLARFTAATAAIE